MCHTHRRTSEKGNKATITTLTQEGETILIRLVPK
jgi:hypothetical protein